MIPERVTFTVRGLTRLELHTAARDRAAAYFGQQPHRVTEVNASPFVSMGSGKLNPDVRSWEADVTA